jgi:signal peptidase I
VGAAVATLVIARSRPFRVEVTGTSMEPALVPGDYLMATKSGQIRRGAVVVLDRPGTPGFELVKRVAGIPGDSIDGRLLGGDEYWVVGETGARSTDSRTFGPVARKEIQGVVRLRYWPLSRLRWFPNG